MNIFISLLLLIGSSFRPSTDGFAALYGETQQLSSMQFSKIEGMTYKTIPRPFRQAQGTWGAGGGILSLRSLSLSKGQGAKAAVVSGFVSMFRQAQHVAGSMNLGMGRFLNLRFLEIATFWSRLVSLPRT